MPDLPKRLLKDVVWMLRPTLYGSREQFDTAVRDYHVRILKSADRWRPSERVLAAPQILLEFECWEGDEQVDATLELSTDDPEGWTTLELMFAVHQGIAGYLAERDGSLGDHCFFEGLSLRSAKPGKPPVYDVSLGS